MDVEGVRPQAAAHGHGENFPVFHKHGALHLQALIMPERPGHGDAFHHIVPRGVGLHPGAVPFADHALGSGEVAAGQILQFKLGMLCPEAVDVVPFFLEFPTFQVGQIVHGINVVIAVPVGAVEKFVGKPPLQLRLIGRGHADDAAGNAPLFSVEKNFLDHGAPIPVADGVGVDAPAIEMGKKRHAAVGKHQLLPPPEIEVGEGIFASSGRTGKQNALIVVLLGQLGALKIEHGHTFLIF